MVVVRVNVKSHVKDFYAQQELHALSQKIQNVFQVLVYVILSQYVNQMFFTQIHVVSEHH
jgi:hypothetical protein